MVSASQAGKQVPPVAVMASDRGGGFALVDGLNRTYAHWLLRRPQDHIKGGDGIAAVLPAEQLAGGGVAALEHGLEPGHGCFALQPQAAGAGAVPPAWGLAVAGQVLLVVGGQLAGVVGLPAYRELGDVGHHPLLPSRRRWREHTHPWCIALLGKDCGSRVVRNGDGHPLWQAQLQTGGVLVLT